MDPIARIGSSIFIKGEVTTSEPLVIAGRIEGTLDATGQAVTLDPEGLIQANVTAHTLLIAGNVNGKLHAGARIVVRATATVEGDVSAPAVSVAEGATLKGRIETAARRQSGASAANLDAEPSAA